MKLNIFRFLLCSIIGHLYLKVNMLEFGDQDVLQALCPFDDMRKALHKGAIIAGQAWEVVN